MSEKLRRLKQKYDEIDKTIMNLHANQRDILELIKEECTHSELIELYSDSIYNDDEESRYKCKDCYQYFNELQVVHDNTID